jgi:ATP-dependent RNA helicase DDX56/DBP9
MPPDPAGYVHRVGRTGRANKTGASISLVSPKENGIFEDIENMLKDVENRDTSCISPFPLLTKNAVESLRYRAQVWSILQWIIYSFVLKYVFNWYFCLYSIWC